MGSRPSLFEVTWHHRDHSTWHMWFPILVVHCDHASILHRAFIGEAAEYASVFTKCCLLPPPRRLCFCQFLFFVCLFVCQDNSKSYERIFLKFWGYVGHDISYKWLNFGDDPAGILDSGSLWNFRYHCVKGGIKAPQQNRRWWRHLANSFALAEVPAGYGCFLVELLLCILIGAAWGSAVLMSKSTVAGCCVSISGLPLQTTHLPHGHRL